MVYKLPPTTNLKERVMSIIESKTEEELKQEFEALDQMMDEEDKQTKKRAILSWVASGAMHLTVMLILGTIAFGVMKEEEIDAPPVRISLMEAPKDPPKPKENIDVIKDPLNIVETTETPTNDKTIITDIDIKSTEFSSEDETVAEVPKGRDEAVSDAEMGGPGAFMAIGPGGGGKGMFGKRIGGGKNRTIGRAFGPHATGVKTGLEAALRWLKKHQSPNGMWSAQNYNINCQDDPKCEPGKGNQGADEAMTGYAILCFLGAGYDHKVPSAYKATVKKGLEWLVSNQKADGLIGNRNYEHPIAAQALAEAYGMTNDPELREPSQKAIDIIVARQNIDDKAVDKAYAGLGWDYIKPNPSRNDSSVTVWNIMALKSARASGLNVGNSLDGSKKWLEGAWRAANPNWKSLSDPYKDTSIFPYVWNANTNATEKDHLSFAGGCAAVFLGHGDGDIMLNSLVNDMDKRWLDTGKWQGNAYCIYYASLTAFQVGGDHWKKWRDAYVPYLIQNQIKDEGCKRGTWNYGNQEFHGWDTSRILIHVYYTLAFEVAIRYEVVNQPKKK